MDRPYAMCQEAECRYDASILLRKMLGGERP